MEQMLDRAFAHRDLPRLQVLMDFADTSVFSIAQPSHQRDDIQSTFSMWQRPSTFFFWAVGLVVMGAGLIAASTDHDGQLTQSLQRHEPSMNMIGDPHRLLADLTDLSLRL